MKSKKRFIQRMQNFSTKTGIKQLHEKSVYGDWNNYLIFLKLKALEEFNSFLKSANRNSVMTQLKWQPMYRLSIVEDI